MKPFKIKMTTKPGRRMLIHPRYPGMVCRLESVYYGSTNPSSQLRIFDKDGDMVGHPIPGQLEGNNLVILENALTIQMPLEYEVDDGEDIFILNGTLHKSVYE